MKIKTVTFSYRADEAPAQYRCEKVTDSLEYKPGSSYGKIDVQALCDSKAWKVTVVERTS